MSGCILRIDGAFVTDCDRQDFRVPTARVREIHDRRAALDTRSYQYLRRLTGGIAPAVFFRARVKRFGE